uniref:Uncharacterized protein n=1 Tax=Picea glauca TaxID=3330 RepID=A0A101M4H1_PICGL|nr:hypothetical protein ABT39_MTgene541 [Picea glauca]
MSALITCCGSSPAKRSDELTQADLFRVEAVPDYEIAAFLATVTAPEEYDRKQTCCACRIS